jgi:uncharacterized SAM-binding protein YcdF (DUF218 family)
MMSFAAPILNPARCTAIRSGSMREIFSYSFVMPPTIFIVICLAGALIALAWPRVGAVIVLVSIIFLYLFSMPAVSMLLMRQLVSLVPAKVDFTDAQAIVIPCVDVRWGSGTKIPDSVGVQTLERLASAARLYRRLRLPILVSGGRSLHHAGASLASLMQRELEQNFFVPVRFLEEKSHNTFENALYASQILKEHGISNAIVVAQARDMPRLLWSFDRVGIHAMPFVLNEPQFSALEIHDFLPSAEAFGETYYEMHEIVGLAYYKIFY